MEQARKDKGQQMEEALDDALPEPEERMWLKSAIPAKTTTGIPAEVPAWIAAPNAVDSRVAEAPAAAAKAAAATDNPSTVNIQDCGDNFFSRGSQDFFP